MSAILQISWKVIVIFSKENNRGWFSKELEFLTINCWIWMFLPSLKQLRLVLVSSNWTRTDECSIGNPGVVDWGGFIRNSHGNWVEGLSKSIGKSSSVLTGLLGSSRWHQTSCIGRESSIIHLETELDASIVVQQCC